MKKRKTLRGTVRKVLKPTHAKEPEKVEIEIEHADPLYREIRIENTLTDDQGEKASLKEGAEIEVNLEADSSATVKKPG